MWCIRFSLLEPSKIEILLNGEFVEVFRNVLKLVEASEKGEIHHHAEVKPEDLEKLTVTHCEVKQRPEG